MKWASHLSTKDNIEACIDESIEAIRSQMGGDSVHLTVIFVSPQFKDKYNEIPKLIRERMDPGRFLGCSGGGIVGGGREAEQQPAFSITCASLPDVEIKSIYSDGLYIKIRIDSDCKFESDIINYLLNDNYSIKGIIFEFYKYQKSKRKCMCIGLCISTFGILSVIIILLNQ